MSVHLVPLRQRHIFDLTGSTSPWPFVGFAGIDEEGVAGVGGVVHREGEWIAGLHIRPGAARRYPLALYRAARALLPVVLTSGAARVFASCDPSIERSEAFIRRLGFRPVDFTVAGEPGWVLER